MYDKYRDMDPAVVGQIADIENQAAQFLSSAAFTDAVQAQIKGITPEDLEAERATYRNCIPEMIESGVPAEDGYDNLNAILEEVRTGKVTAQVAIARLLADPDPLIRDEIGYNLREDTLRKAELAIKGIHRSYWSKRVNEQTPPRRMPGSFGSNTR